jgi:hypothetical protein
MLIHRHRPVYLSLMSFDLPIWSTIETAATLYQKDEQRFHLLLTEPLIKDEGTDPLFPQDTALTPQGVTSVVETPRLLWFEISPCRVIMTMQGNGRFSYRHLWGQGIYGLSRYWLQHPSLKDLEQIRLRNYTRSLEVSGHPLPHQLRLEYELWSQQLRLGHYVLNLEIEH